MAKTGKEAEEKKKDNKYTTPHFSMVRKK